MDGEEILKEIISSMQDGCVVLDAEGTTLFVNSAFCRMTDFSQEELAGKRAPYPYGTKKEINSFEETLNKAVEEKGPEVEIVLKKKNDEPFPTLFTASRILDDDGNISRYITIFKDISERSRAEKKIEHLNRVLRTISDVNQIIIKEKNRGQLIKRICDTFVKNRGYYSSWIVLQGEDGTVVFDAQSGLDEEFSLLVERFKKGDLPDCAQRALATPGVQSIENTLTQCRCPLIRSEKDKRIMTVRIEHEGKIYGVLNVSTPNYSLTDT
ncbi:PAS domain-containing protein [candidate division CSSED10-310 bacterium]|uniref:PAS domain-containing protein n=1 Tax=candidate division CSSED10-310 bacterium TaxID=2855610 RepID=A0ABV6YVB5_UNCC1